MIAYDFDGVLIPDFENIPNLGGIKDFYEMTQFIKPNFHPKGDWSIITGRLGIHRKFTESYVDKHFKDNKPRAIHHERDIHTKPHEYKAKVLQDYDAQIILYIESDPFTVEYLQSEVPSCSIYLFSDLVSTDISDLYKSL